MTLNQVIQRIRILATAHKQIRQFDAQRDVVEFLRGKNKPEEFPCCLVLDRPGTLFDIQGNQVTFAFTMFMLDLVHQNQDTKRNEQDAQSDMMSVAADLIAQINYSGYSDWKIDAAVPVNFVQEQMDGNYAGVTVDISITTMWVRDVCAVPANSYTFPIIDTSMKPVNDLVYVTTGDEGSTLTIPTLRGKMILMLVRQSFTQYEVNAFDADQSIEFLWAASDDPLVNINLGTPVNPGERFLILYRNF